MPNRRFLDVLDTLSSARTQPYVHDILVTVTYMRKSYTFRVFFKHHRLLWPNQAIRALANVNIHGDVLLASVGKRVEIRNIQSGPESKAADIAVKKWAYIILFISELLIYVPDSCNLQCTPSATFLRKLFSDFRKFYLLHWMMFSFWPLFTISYRYYLIVVELYSTFQLINMFCMVPLILRRV